jgi:hypothetical protein
MKTLASELASKCRPLTWDERYLTEGDPFVWVYYTNPLTGLKQKRQVRKETVLKVRDALLQKYEQESKSFTLPELYRDSLRHIGHCIERELRKSMPKNHSIQVIRL